jgi:hypothetical protein
MARVFACTRCFVVGRVAGENLLRLQVFRNLSTQCLSTTSPRISRRETAITLQEVSLEEEKDVLGVDVTSLAK